MRRPFAPTPPPQTFLPVPTPEGVLLQALFEPGNRDLDEVLKYQRLCAQAHGTDVETILAQAALTQTPCLLAWLEWMRGAPDAIDHHLKYRHECGRFLTAGVALSIEPMFFASSWRSGGWEEAWRTTIAKAAAYCRRNKPIENGDDGADGQGQASAPAPSPPQPGKPKPAEEAEDETPGFRL